VGAAANEHAVEEERLGGYCVFDMTFVEWGVPPSAPQLSSQDNLLAA